MIFKTESGSVYEVNESTKKIRRIFGKGSATPRQGKDQEWKDYLSITTTYDNCLLITWSIENNVAKTTMTSPLIEAEDFCVN